MLQEVREEYGQRVDGVTAEALQALCAFDWPGNVRELNNVIIQASLMTSDSRLDIEHLPQRLLQRSERSLTEEATLSEDRPGSLWLSLGQPLDEVQKAYVLRTLEHCESNKAQAARVLGISRKTLYDRLARWNAGK